MVLDYLTIPGVFFNPSSTSVSSSFHFLSATSVDVERIFSCGHLVLSHVHGQLSVQSTRALLCLGSWSLLGLVKNTDVLAVTVLDNIEGNEELELDDGWDSILQ